MTRNKIFKVSEFNEYINAFLSKLDEVIVEGEISQIKISQGKWLFITIKDSSSNVEVFGVADRISGVRDLEEGMLVNVYGNPRLYKKSGRFSIFANQIIPSGEGALAVAFEKLKLRLEQEGLFDPARKRRLPMFPQRIGLVTAKGSQAYSDFIKVLKHRIGGLKISFFPVSVQGGNSIQTILNAFKYINAHYSELDLLVLTRGGGSIEDLQSFNDENVARAIFSSKVPVVCGIGHEDNITIADLVADVRASTPSNAAEIIVKKRDEVLSQIDYSIRTMSYQIEALLKNASQAVLEHVNLLSQAVNRQIYSVHRLIDRFYSTFKVFISNLQNDLRRLLVSRKGLVISASAWIKHQQKSLDSTTRLLISLDFEKVLERGFSMTFDKNGKILKSISSVKKGDSINTTLFDGKINSGILSISKK